LASSLMNICPSIATILKPWNPAMASFTP
jgi:hypothetical protein